MAETLQNVNCKNCGAPVPLAIGEVLVTCDYCGTVFNQVTDKAFVLGHSFIPDAIDRNRANTLVRGWMRGDSKPASLHKGAQVTHLDRTFLPFFVFEIQARTKYKGGMTRTGGWVPREGNLIKDYHWKILGRRGGSFPTREFDIPLTSKIPFDMSKAPKGGKFLNSELDEDEALQIAKQEIEAHHRHLLSDDLDSLDKMKTDYTVDETEFVHAPIWDVTYSFNGRNYRMFVDGGRGYVIKGEVPPPDTSAKGFMSTFKNALFGN